MRLLREAASGGHRVPSWLKGLSRDPAKEELFRKCSPASASCSPPSSCPCRFWCSGSARPPCCTQHMSNSPATRHCARRPKPPSRSQARPQGRCWRCCAPSRRPRPKGRTPPIHKRRQRLPIPPRPRRLPSPNAIVSATPEPERTAALTAQACFAISFAARESGNSSERKPDGNGGSDDGQRRGSASQRGVAGTGRRRGDRYSGCNCGQDRRHRRRRRRRTNPHRSSPSNQLPAGTDADPIAAKIATLGGPPAPVETQAPDKARSAEIKAAAIRAAANRALGGQQRTRSGSGQRAERARERRPLAAARRAQQARQAGSAPQAASPFAQPPAAAAQQQAPNRYARHSARQTQRRRPRPKAIASDQVRRRRSQPAARRAIPIRPKSRHRGRSRARPTGRAQASTPTPRRRSRSSSRSAFDVDAGA